MVPFVAISVGDGTKDFSVYDIVYRYSRMDGKLGKSF